MVQFTKYFVRKVILQCFEPSFNFRSVSNSSRALVWNQQCETIFVLADIRKSCQDQELAMKLISVFFIRKCIIMKCYDMEMDGYE